MARAIIEDDGEQEEGEEDFRNRVDNHDENQND
jgi:hypothetical protein